MTSFLGLHELPMMPGFAATQAMWRELEVRQAPLESPAAAALLAELSRTFRNGGALLARFALGYHPTMHWFASRGQWERMGFLDGFLRSGAVAAALPELEPKPGLSLAGAFERGSLFTLDGEVARALFGGGAYDSYRGSAADAKRLAAAYVRERYGERYDEAAVFASGSAWAGWFRDIAWDFSWVVVDLRHRTVDLLFITDTD